MFQSVDVYSNRKAIACSEENMKMIVYINTKVLERTWSSIKSFLAIQFSSFKNQLIFFPKFIEPFGAPTLQKYMISLRL